MKIILKIKNAKNDISDFFIESILKAEYIRELRFVSAFGYYHETPAFLIDSLDGLTGWTYWMVIQSANSTVFDIVLNHLPKEAEEFWILGKSYSRIKLTPNNETYCGKLSCYEKSLKTNKICKPGILKIY